MPRGGPPTNTYVLPAIYLAVPGTTILSQQHNTPLEDIEAVLNQAWPTNIGGTGGTSVITSYDALNARGTAVASAANIDLSAVTGPNLHITGTTTVTSVALTSGQVRQVIADAAFQLTASASLIVNGSAVTSYTTAIGDYLLFIGDPLGVVRVWVNKGGGPFLPLSGGTLTTASAGTLLGLTSTDSGASAGPVLDLYRDSASPAINDILGNITFSGRDSAANKQEYGAIEVSIADPVSGSEDSAMNFLTPVAGVRSSQFVAGGATAGISLPGPNSIYFTTLSNYYMNANVGTGNPGINFDAGDFMDYERASNTYRFSAGAVTSLYIAPGLVTPAALGRGAPITKTANFTVGDIENWLINNKSGSSCTVTFPSAALWPGREIMIKNIQTQTVVSATSNVVPLAGGAAGTAILSANAGRWCTLVSDSTNWVIMAGVI